MVDSSVAIKWFTIEPRHELAKAILGAGDDLITPVLAHAEIANALWRKIRKQEIGPIQAEQAIHELPRMVALLQLTPTVIQAAYTLAKELEHSVYDCIFLGTTLQHDGFFLLTDDEKFAAKLAGGGYADKIRRLSDGPIHLTFSDGQLSDLLRLFEKSKETIEFVASKTGKNLARSELKLHTAADLSPAYESPPYVRLRREIGRLTPHQTAVLLGVAWLGRGYDGENFQKLNLQAEHLASAPNEHAAYIISQIGYLNAGIEKYRLQQTSKDA